MYARYRNVIYCNFIYGFSSDFSLLHSFRFCLFATPPVSISILCVFFLLLLINIILTVVCFINKAMMIINEITGAHQKLFCSRYLLLFFFFCFVLLKTIPRYIDECYHLVLSSSFSSFSILIVCLFPFKFRYELCMASVCVCGHKWFWCFFFLS